MTKTEIRTAVKDAVAEQFIQAFANAVQIDDYTYAIPMGTAPDSGQPIYAKVEISAPNWYRTVKTEPFNLDEKVASYNAELAERARKATEKAKEAIEKEAKRQAE